MIIIFKKDAPIDDKSALIQRIEDLGLQVNYLKNMKRTIIGISGDLKILHKNPVNAMPGVDRVINIQDAYELISRNNNPKDAHFFVKSAKIGEKITVIAGPCAIENRESFLQISQKLADAGADILRGGAFKPRTSPYSFQGLGQDGLKILKEASNITGLPTITEVMEIKKLDQVAQYADILQIGARNMQNYPLLKAAGEMKKPILIKRNTGSTIEEFLMAAEYLATRGCGEIILCERGIRTFENATRSTLDLSAVPLIRERSNLPIFVDPSHSTGKKSLVRPMIRSAIMAGAHGIMVEVHPNPGFALSDGEQSIDIETFEKIMADLRLISELRAKLDEEK